MHDAFESNEESIPPASEFQRTGDIQYKEYLRKEVCVVLSYGKQEWKTDFSKDQWKIIKQEGFFEKT